MKDETVAKIVMKYNAKGWRVSSVLAHGMIWTNSV
jgi:hypothetical protein